MEHTPPPFFKRGPAPLVRLAFFALLSLALIVVDGRFRFGEGLRSALALATQPLQAAATAPASLARRIAAYFSSQSALREENAELRARLIESSQAAQRNEAAAAEAARLRRLIGAAERLPGGALVAEILYAGRDPFSRKIVVDKGSRSDVRDGSPVADEAGVLGQVTRVHALFSEVTLLTDKNQAIPVQVVRNGLRALAYGAGPSGLLELRFLAANADVVNGDQLVTSGLDRIYPPGLAVATVVRVERDTSNAFARVYCQPAAGVERGRYVLVLGIGAAPAAPPAQAAEEREKPTSKTRRTRRKGSDGTG